MKKKIVENYKSVLDTIDKETQGIKTVVSCAYISTSMGPSARITVSEL